MSQNTSLQHPFVPRFIRVRDAPFYLGMDKNRFNTEVRPSLTEIPIGIQGIAFDRNELDAWADDYVRRLGQKQNKKNVEFKSCQKRVPVSQNATAIGTSTKSSKVNAFTKALAQATSKKRSAT